MEMRCKHVRKTASACHAIEARAAPLEFVLQLETRLQIIVLANPTYAQF